VYVSPLANDLPSAPQVYTFPICFPNGRCVAIVAAVVSAVADRLRHDCLRVSIDTFLTLGYLPIFKPTVASNLKDTNGHPFVA
jgi:hypothetical protein